ncbi:MAG: hypothetical protein V1724_10475, partial [Chloroflexota bacterium]
WISEKTEAERAKLIDPDYMDQILRWLFGNILLKASGGDYERLETHGLELTTPGAREVVARSADVAGATALGDWLLNLLEGVQKLPEWTALESATAQLTDRQPRLRDIVLQIDAAIDGIAMMRAFPGRCHLCPV